MRIEPVVGRATAHTIQYSLKAVLAGNVDVCEAISPLPVAAHDRAVLAKCQHRRFFEKSWTGSAGFDRFFLYSEESRARPDSRAFSLESPSAGAFPTGRTSGTWRSFLLRKRRSCHRVSPPACPKSSSESAAPGMVLTMSSTTKNETQRANECRRRTSARTICLRPVCQRDSGGCSGQDSGQNALHSGVHK